MFPPQNPDLQPESMWNYERLPCRETLLDGRFPIRSKSLLHRRQKPHHAFAQSQWNRYAQSELRHDRQYRRGTSGSLPYQSIVVGGRQLQLPAHGESVIAAPEHKLYAGANFTKRSLGVSTGLQYIAGLYGRRRQSAAGRFCAVEPAGLFPASASGLTSGCVAGTCWRREYEINAGYPMPRATVMAGLNVNFRAPPQDHPSATRSCNRTVWL